MAVCSQFVTERLLFEIIWSLPLIGYLKLGHNLPFSQSWLFSLGIGSVEEFAVFHPLWVCIDDISVVAEIDWTCIHGEI
jgi:hypothetical protein